MKRHGALLFRWALISACSLAVAVLLLTRVTRAQTGQPVHSTRDWSHRHMIFSPPNSVEKTLSLQSEPRYQQQLLRKNLGASRPMTRSTGGPQATDHSDWAIPLPAGATVGDGMVPSKFDFDITTPPNCLNDYVVYNTSLVGSSSVPSVVAFDELYSTQGSAGGFCNQNGPSVKWAYNTNLSGDTTGRVVTSTVLSGDGTKVAYVETRSNANGGAILHILEWKPGNTSTVEGTMTAPATPDQTLAPGAPWSSCTAGNSCVVNITFSNAQPDTNSPPYYDFSIGSDTLYIGDDSGVLHKFKGVFNGTPTEVTSAPWPITVSSGHKLTGPIFDTSSRNIFVGDSSGTTSYVKESGSTTGACGSGTPPCLGAGTLVLGGAIVDAPIVDGTNQTVFTFDGTASTGNAAVVQTDTALNIFTTANVGAAGTLGIPIHAGDFDNAYFNSSYPTVTGNLYVCGKDSGGTDTPELYQIGIDSHAIMNSSPHGSPLALASAGGDECSPPTEIYNTATSTDWLFFSVTNNANQTGCASGGCIMSLNLTTLGSWPPSGVTAAKPASGGTSAITIDNVANTTTYPQASNIYFSYLSNAGAVTVNNADFLNPPCNPNSNSGCNFATEGGVSIWWSPPPTGMAGWNPVQAGVVTAASSIMANPPNGSNQVGYTQDYNQFSQGAYLSQILDGSCGGVSCPGGNSNVMLTANVTYTLTVNVGSRTDGGPITGTVFLQAHTGPGLFSPLATASVALSTGGQWATTTVSYTVPPSSPFTGQPLAIAFKSTGGQGEWNNSQVSSSTAPATCNGTAGVGCAVKLTQMGLN
jgi:hypothetical protein